MALALALVLVVRGGAGMVRTHEDEGVWSGCLLTRGQGVGCCGERVKLVADKTVSVSQEGAL